MEIDYREVLKAIEGKNVELRHDVDLSLISAYNMAKIENEMGVKSIYYIRFDCDYYNAMSNNSAYMLSYMYSMGHSIGLHVDSNVVTSEDILKKYLQYYDSSFHFKYFTFHINSDNTKKFIKESSGNFINKSIVCK